MNLISIAVSTFITNYIIMVIIRLLPIRKKTIWQGAVISLFCLGEIAGYVFFIFSSSLDWLFILTSVGSIFGILIGYIASMMIVLDGISIFKSKRLREFERNLNHKEGASVPRWILAILALGLSLPLFVYGSFTCLHYESPLLVTIIGCFLGGALFLGISIYFFLSGKPQHQKLHAQNLLLIITMEQQKLLYKTKLTKEFRMEDALKKLEERYILDEYGIIITPTESLIVKGLRLEPSAKDLINSLDIPLYEGTEYLLAIEHFQKYNRKKIVLDENNQIKKITSIK